MTEKLSPTQAAVLDKMADGYKLREELYPRDLSSYYIEYPDARPMRPVRTTWRKCNNLQARDLIKLYDNTEDEDGQDIFRWYVITDAGRDALEVRHD